jgi:hypothetical protein
LEISQYSTVGFLAQSACKVVREELKLDDGQEGLPKVIEKAFLSTRSQWIDEPVSAQWTALEPRILKTLQDANLLYHQWIKNKPGPFYPFCDELWMQTTGLLREADLPWHNNNVNISEKIDQIWPFHFKDFERQAVISKAAGVDNNQASGYIYPWGEANHYGI